MGSDVDLLMIVAFDESGPRLEILTAVLSRECAQSLIGPGKDVAGAILDPDVVLDSLDAYIPQTRESRNERSAILRLALVAQVRGLRLRCDGTDPTAWTPQQDRHYLTSDVQAALTIIAEQLHCTVDHAAHRLFALVDESGAPLRGTSQAVISGQLSFIGSPTGPTVSLGDSPSPD